MATLREDIAAAMKEAMKAKDQATMTLALLTSYQVAGLMKMETAYSLTIKVTRR